MGFGFIVKVCPPQNIKSDLRPIALSSCLAKVLEGFTNRRLLNHMSDSIDPRQYARHGHSTVHPLIYLMQAIHEAIDSGNCSFRIFVADFTKGFDIIDHSVLLDELRSFNIDQTLFFGYVPFIPTEHKLCVSAPPCHRGNKSMVVSHREQNFMKNSITAMRPITVGNQEVERVGTYKLLGVIIRDDLKWNTHVEYVIAKAAKRLYALRLLKRAGVMPEDMLKVYTCNIRSVLEYAVEVWQDIPTYLSDAIESIQRGALKIFPNFNYQQALDQSNLTFLVDRRISICNKLMAKMRNEDHPISFLAPQAMTRFIPYQLRSGNTRAITSVKRTKRANDFFTFRYS